MHNTKFLDVCENNEVIFVKSLIFIFFRFKFFKFEHPENMSVIYRELDVK